MRTLKREHRQVLAVALLLAVIALLVGGIVQPLLRYYLSTEEEISSLEQQLEVYRRLARQLPEQEQRLAQLQQQDPAALLLFQESRPALAAANLQQLVGQLVAQVGGQVVSTQIMPSERSAAPLPEIALRVQMRGDNPALVGVLHGLAYNQPLLLTTDLTVIGSAGLRPTQRLRRNRKTGAQPLEMSFTVVGYTRQEVGEVNSE